MNKITFYKYFNDLECLGLIIPSRKIGRATLYRINSENSMVKLLGPIRNATPSINS